MASEINLNVKVRGEKRIIPLGESATDKVVMQWLKRVGIDPALVKGYTIIRGVRDLSTITLDCIFTDPADIEKEG